MENDRATSLAKLGISHPFPAQVGDEFYAARWPELVGLPWREIAFRFSTAIPIGVRTLDDQLILNPPLDRVLGDGDEIIVLAEDNDTYAPGAKIEVDISPPP